MTSYRNINNIMRSGATDKQTYFSDDHHECEFNTILIPSLIFMLVFVMFFHIGYSFEVHKGNFNFFANKVMFFSKSAFALR